jgi:shikimate O-hydroxycinnamoyltransferase
MRLPLPYSYFGNALVWLGATTTAQDIALEPSISRMDDELVRSAIDYLKLAEVDSRQLRGSMAAVGRRRSG